jgi:arylesterase / paraoxonase
MKKIMKTILILLLLIGAFVFNSVYHSGYFKTINNFTSGKSKRINGLIGTEDITIDQATGIAFLSSYDRRATRAGMDKKGVIYTLNMNDSILTPIAKTTDFQQADFHPHGISLYTAPEGKKRFFVVNHRNTGNFIEIFDYKNDTLQHIESISDPLLVSPNDIVGVGERSFYVTNDHDEKASEWRSIKDLMRIGMGNVCYFDGQKMQKTGIEGIQYANGINCSKDGKTLYLAGTSAKAVWLFNRDIATGALTEIEKIDTHTGVDNIELDTAGVLWIGCHPQMLKFLSHAKDENAPSPSEIITIKYIGKGKYGLKTVYMNDGSVISGSAVGAAFKDKLLIGPVFAPYVVVDRL